MKSLEEVQNVKAGGSPHNNRIEQTARGCHVDCVRNRRASAPPGSLLIRALSPTGSLIFEKDSIYFQSNNMESEFRPLFFPKKLDCLIIPQTLFTAPMEMEDTAGHFSSRITGTQLKSGEYGIWWKKHRIALLLASYILAKELIP